jgi:hypothetical protein
VDEQMLMELCAKPYIPCEVLSTDEIVVRMRKAKSRRAATPPSKRKTAPLAGTRPRTSRKDVTKKANQMDELKKLVAGGMDLSAALEKVSS